MTKCDLYKNFRKAKIYSKSGRYGKYKVCRGRYYYWECETPYFKNPIYCNGIKFENFVVFVEWIQNNSFISNKIGL